MKTKIQNKKILYNSSRIVCNGKGMPVEQLIKIVEQYLYEIRKLKEIKGIQIDQEKMNYGIKIELFKIPCTIEKLFELYNEIAEIEELRVYSKL